MDSLFGFLADTTGRIVRAAVGIVIVLIGLLAVGGTAGVIVALIGLVPVAAGVFDFCLFGALLGYPFRGKDLVAKVKSS